MRDYYEILNVARDADADAIKKAYRQLALQHHPDRNNGSKEAEERFREATEAYEILRDPDKRAAYDRYGHAGVKRGAGGTGFEGFDFADALEIFMRDFGGFNMGDIFGGARRGGRGGARRGVDMRVELPLTLEDVASGVKKSIRLKVFDSCGTCEGSGAAPGTSPVRCATCGGAGEVRRVQRSFLGQLVSVSPCPSCGGEGQQIAEPCATCDGRGVERAERTVDVDVPPGVSSGDYLTLRGQGNAAPRGGIRGDVLVVIDVEEDPRFRRDGADLIYELPLTFSQAALGAEVEVPTVDGIARVRIAPGTQSGRLLRLRGKGLPHLQSAARGDLIVRVMVWTPTQLTGEQEELFRRLAEIEESAPRPGEDRDERNGFWNKVKEALGG
jgi:molecular chaperone DnaJ